MFYEVEVTYTMRRKDRALTDWDAMSILRKAEYGVLSTASPAAEPYGVPLNFCLIENAIYLHSAAEGHKINNISHNHKVSFCVVGETEVLPKKFGTKYESAIVFGKAEEVDGSEKQLGLEGLLKKYSSQFFHEGLKYIESFIDQTTVYKIIIESITGKACK